MSINSELTRKELSQIALRRRLAREKALSLEPPTEEEEAAIREGALADPDAQLMTETELAAMLPAHEAQPGLVIQHLRQGRGRPRAENPKRQITLRLDPEVVGYFENTGKGWRTLINDELRVLVRKKLKAR